jgi:hypothetical protein
MLQAKLDHFEAALDLPEGVVDGLAMLRGEQFGEVHPSCGDELAKGEHDVLALSQR